MVPVVVCDNEVKTVLVFLNLSYFVSRFLVLVLFLLSVYFLVIIILIIVIIITIILIMIKMILNFKEGAHSQKVVFSGAVFSFVSLLILCCSVQLLTNMLSYVD